MRLTLKSAAVAALTLVGSAVPALAQSPLDHLFELAGACTDDHRRFCPGVPLGGGRVADCLNRHKYELSPVCYRAFMVGSAIRACAPDYYRLCDGVPPGEGRIVQCLQENIRDVSDYCRSSLAAAKPGYGHESASSYAEDPDGIDENDYNGGHHGKKRDYEDRDRYVERGYEERGRYTPRPYYERDRYAGEGSYRRDSYREEYQDPDVLK